MNIAVTSLLLYIIVWGRLEFLISYMRPVLHTYMKTVMSSELIVIQVIYYDCDDQYNVYFITVTIK